MVADPRAISTRSDGRSGWGGSSVRRGGVTGAVHNRFICQEIKIPTEIFWNFLIEVGKGQVGRKPEKCRFTLNLADLE